MYIQEIKWTVFSAFVIGHIRNYVVPQYGDDGTEPAKEYTMLDCVKQMERYITRLKNGSSRPEENARDLLKIAHWAQKAHDRLPKE